MYVASLRNLPDSVIDCAKSKAELKRRCVQIHKLNLNVIDIREVEKCQQ